MPLTLSCFVNGLFAALAVAVLTTYAVDEIYQSDLSEKGWLAATLAAFCSSIAMSVWAIIGIWRSAARYQAKAGTIRSAFLAKLFASIGALGLVAQLSQTPSLIVENALVVGGIYPFGFPAELTVNGRTLHIDGSITPEVAKQFKELIGKHHQVERVSLISPGGSIDAAIEISSLIKERNLSTVAAGECSSACTLIFLSSKVRIYGAGAFLGFHSPSGGGAGDVAVNATSPETRLAFVDAGLSETFADKAFGTPSNSMWYPTADILIKEGAINLFTKARIRQDHEELAKSFNETKPLKIDEFVSIVSARRDGTNLIYTLVFSLSEDEIDWAAMSKETADNAYEVICSDAISNLMVKSGATYTYLYVDKIGKKVGTVKVDNCNL